MIYPQVACFLNASIQIFIYFDVFIHVFPAFPGFRQDYMAVNKLSSTPWGMRALDIWCLSESSRGVPEEMEIFDDDLSWDMNWEIWYGTLWHTVPTVIAATGNVIHSNYMEDI